jgi:hypothetical protein
MSNLRCSAVIPITPEDGIECRGPASVMTEEGPRCASCFAEFGGTLVEEPAAPFDLGSLMSSVIGALTAA